MARKRLSAPFGLPPAESRPQDRSRELGGQAPDDRGGGARVPGARIPDARIPGDRIPDDRIPDDRGAAGPAMADPPAPGAEGAPEAAVPPAALPPGARLRDGPPISRIAGDSAAAAALETLAAEVAQLRAGGRLVAALPLAAVAEDHLVRDRLEVDPDEMRVLVESLRLHGQRHPVDVIDLGQGRYGLISGWRRLAALRRLSAETGEPRFGQVLALLRRPEAAAEAYVAMVEENEIRAGLSYYERARIAAKAVEAGAFPDRGAALRALYAASSRARRSKIGSFLLVHDALGGALRFPAAIPERLGLALAARIAVAPALTGDLVADLLAEPSETPEQEVVRLTGALEPEAVRPNRPERGDVSRAKRFDAGSGAGSGSGSDWGSGSGRGAAWRPDPGLPSGTDPGEEVVPGIRLTAAAGRAVLSGPGITPDFLDRLDAWLRQS